MGFFTKKITVEDAIASYVKMIPRCIQLVHEESRGASPIPNATIANVSAGMFLFFLAGELPYSDEVNIPKMARAFQAMWAYVPHVGGDAEGARDWFQEFNMGLLDSTSLPNRISITTNTVRQRLFSSASFECPLDILPYTISSGVAAIRKVKLK